MNGQQEVTRDILDMGIMKVSKTGSNAIKKHMMSVAQNTPIIGIATCSMQTVRILSGTIAFGMTLIVSTKIKHLTRKDLIRAISTVTLMQYATQKVQNQKRWNLSSNNWLLLHLRTG